MAIDLLKTPSEYNIAWSWVTAILPDGATTPWGVAMSIFSSTLTYLGTFAIGWAILIGIISSAHSGKVLGDKYHQIWAPLRIVVGFGLMVPLIAGFSSSHYFLRDIVARPAINLVDSIWVSYLQSAVLEHHQIMPSSAGGSKLVMDILESEICAAINNTRSQMLGEPIPAVKLPAKEGKLAEGARHWTYGSRCGAVSMPTVEGMPGYTADREQAISDIIETIRERAKAYGEFFAKGHDIHTKEQALILISQGKLPALALELRKMGAEYDAKIAAAVSKEMALDAEGQQRKQKLVDAAKQQGFVMAGMYWGVISKESQEVTELTGLKHNRTAIMNLEDGAIGSGQRYIKEALTTLRNAISGEEAEIGLTANDFASSGDEDSDLLTKLIAPVSRSISEWALARKPDPDKTVIQRIREYDPIADQISSGHTFMSVSTVGIVAATVPIIAAFTSPADWAGLDGAALWIMGWVSPLFGTLWIIGAVRAYILPALPFIYMAVFASLWLLAVLEAAIALIIWAFGWLRMDGEDFLAQASKVGGMLLFSIFLMPAIGMLLFCACFILLPLVIGTVDLMWAKAFYSSSGGHVPGLGALVVGYVMITFLTMYLTVHVFGQIFAVSDRILVWFGQQGHGFSDKSMFVATAGAATAVLGKGMPGLPSIPKAGKKDASEGADGGVKPRAD